MRETFEVETGDHPFCEEAREILASRIEERSGARRGGPDSACHLILGIEEVANGGGFRISDAPGGARIVGHSRTGLLAGLGKFLRTLSGSRVRRTKPDTAAWAPMKKSGRGLVLRPPAFLYSR